MILRLSITIFVIGNKGEINMMIDVERDKKIAFEKAIKFYENAIELITYYPILEKCRVDTHAYGLFEIYCNNNNPVSEEKYKEFMQKFMTLCQLFKEMVGYKYKRYELNLVSSYEYRVYGFNPAPKDKVLLSFIFKIKDIDFMLRIYLPLDMLPSEFEDENCKLEKHIYPDSKVMYQYIDKNNKGGL